MCGIVGHLGPKNSVDVVLEGLKRLEYRGYDSAGVSFISSSNDLMMYKKKGKIENLINEIKDKDISARSCIGHTRWATHGGVTDNNAHPHICEEMGIAMVHNGIIENAGELREFLTKEGIQFKSETDSETFLGLLIYHVRNGKNIKDAVIESFKKIHGFSAFVVLNKETSEIFSIKKGAPLVCGMNEVNSEVLVSSDPYALAGIADKIYFPEDEVLCHLSAANSNLLNFYELDGTKSKRYMSKKQSMTHDPAAKGDFEHYMLKEIYEQPELIRSLTQFYFQGEGKESLEAAVDLPRKNLHISACGTAYYAGLVIKDFFEQINRIPCRPEIASEFRYRNPILDKEDLALFISQSGETADTLAAQELCKKSGLKSLSIVNTEGSTLYRDCDVNLLIRAGVEIGVASTKAFTQQVLTGRTLSAVIQNKGMDDNLRNTLSQKYTLLAERIEELLDRSDEIKAVAGEIYRNKGFFYTGRGVYYPIALEGALKLKEIAYVHAEGYAAGELKHGPIALIDEEKVNVALVGPELYEKTVSNIQEIKARKGKIVTIGPEGKKDLEEISDYYIPINFDGLEELSPLYINVVNQLLAYHIAKFLGTDIDKPRNLAKSVTVE
ncbi:glutamine--fructose-6-phosphate transaminase (isomerizing) [Bacteriovorax sp. DB6_IX]|uniref:glutamine--fructose-6-phosphate transaminase (isomerizing) n=1 Tax=Bacteriovorax sp. DB6_IX TaxID=1353530 RepID=UPI00038A42C9|nr:glutamine--fructose-6-phosphate transaminase (isomerizing) [Bacteriovorax sp. DB6_IX]EQC52006.1 glutamine-fructose-6-phosphate transaminase (isomerizing) [Bacteriovorax sp. DB6_IX]